MFGKLSRRWAVQLPFAYEFRKHLDFLPALISTDPANRAWSQSGEDAFFANQLREYVNDGFYVDIGANHPSKLSNTYRLYSMGMRGILVEPDAALCRVLRTWRPQDSIVRAAVGVSDGLAQFYHMYPHVFSTLSAQVCQENIARGMTLIRQETTPVFRLQTILKDVARKGRSIFALLSVDTEGLDEVVLRSNDWSQFRPIYIVVEQNNLDVATNVHQFLESIDYVSVATFGANTIFRDRRL